MSFKNDMLDNNHTNSNSEITNNNSLDDIITLVSF